MLDNQTKQCTSCDIIKDLSEFGKSKISKDNLAYECRMCAKTRFYSYLKTKDGLISNVYSNQKTSSKRRGHRPPEYTKQELKEWLFSQKLFHELHSEWAQSGYLKRLVPSVDRKHDDIHYCMKNIQLMTWEENEQKGHDDMRKGILKHGHNPQKKVCQHTIDDEFIAEYHSMNEAERQTDIAQGSISRCCNGKLKSAGGFKWRYKQKYKEIT